MTKQKLIYTSISVEQDEISKPVSSQEHRVFEEDTKDTLVAWQLEREVQILAVIFFLGIIVIIRLFNKQVENALLFALFLSGVLIAIILSLF